MPESIQHLLDAHSFRVAFLVAAAAAVVLVVANLVLRRFVPERALLPLAGLASAAAVAAGVRSTDFGSGDILLGLALLAAGGLVITVLGLVVEAPLLIGAVAAVPGALVLASDADITTFTWAKTFSIVAIIVGSALVADFDNYQARAGLGPVFMAVTALGVYYTVPDTEEAVVLVGATLPLIFVAFPKPFAALGRSGAFAMVGAVTWTAAVDGRGRASSIVGAVACLGVMLLDPLLDRVLPTRDERIVSPWSWPLLLVLAIHIALVGVASRIAGTRDSLSAAVVITVVAFAVAAVALAFVPQHSVDDATGFP